MRREANGLSSWSAAYSCTWRIYLHVGSAFSSHCFNNWVDDTLISSTLIKIFYHSQPHQLSIWEHPFKLIIKINLTPRKCLSFGWTLQWWCPTFSFLESNGARHDSMALFYSQIRISEKYKAHASHIHLSNWAIFSLTRFPTNWHLHEESFLRIGKWWLL